MSDATRQEISKSRLRTKPVVQETLQPNAELGVEALMPLAVQLGLLRALQAQSGYRWMWITAFAAHAVTRSWISAHWRSVCDSDAECALPLAWHVEAGAANIGFAEQQVLLERVLAWLPPAASCSQRIDSIPGALIGWLPAALAYRIRLKSNFQPHAPASARYHVQSDFRVKLNTVGKPARRSGRLGLQTSHRGLAAWRCPAR